MVASTSLDSASLASTHSRRSRAKASGDCGVVEVQARSSGRRQHLDHVPEDRLVEVDAAEVLDPVGGADDREPALLSSPARIRRRCRRPGRRPPPCRRSESRDRAAYWVAAASGSVQVTASGRSARVTIWCEQLPLVAAPVRRVRDDHLIRRSALALGGDRRPPRRAASRTTPAARTAARRAGSGTVSPIRRLNSRAVRDGSVAARRSAASPKRNVPPCPRGTPQRAPSTPGCPVPASLGPLPSSTAAAVNVVPRSTPSRYPIEGGILGRHWSSRRLKFTLGLRAVAVGPGTPVRVT